MRWHAFAIFLSFPPTLFSLESAYTCHRQGHQSAVIGNLVYAFGGFQDFEAQGWNGFVQPNATQFENTIYQANLSSQWNTRLDKNQFKAIFRKNETPQGLQNLTGGALFPGAPGDHSMYLFGGAPYSPLDRNNSLANLTTVPNKIWNFNLATALWSDTNFTTSGSTNIDVSRHGTYAHARELSVAFYVDVDGLSVINTTSRTIRNIPAALFLKGRRRFGSNLQYIPGLGKKGVLVMFGGAFSSDNQTYPGKVTDMIPLNSIHVLDIASLETGEGTWYEQISSGRTPNPRYDACAVMAVAPDNTSYNIYVFGGRSPTGDFDEIWVLSLPYFRWIKVVKGSFPIFGQHCHLVGSKQMLVLGGNVYTQLSGLHPCYLGRTGTFVFDMTTLQWADKVVIPDRPYEVPLAIVQWIGGTIKGKANKTMPENGFISEGLASLFANSSQRGNNTENVGVSRFQANSNSALWYLMLVLVTWYSL